MPGVYIDDGEHSFDIALRKFKKQVEKAGILSEMKKRQHYEKPSVQRKKKKAAAHRLRRFHAKGEKRFCGRGQCGAPKGSGGSSAEEKDGLAKRRRRPACGRPYSTCVPARAQAAKNASSAPPSVTTACTWPSSAKEKVLARPIF